MLRNTCLVALLRGYAEKETYRVKNPVDVGTASVEVEHATDAVLVVKCARLNVTSYHDVKWRVGRTRGIFYV